MLAGKWVLTGAITLLAGVGIGLSPWGKSFRPGSMDDALLQAVLEADDRRDGSQETHQTLLDGAVSEDGPIRGLSVRAIGRAERPDWLSDLVGPLRDPDAGVRAEAANAVGQSVFSGQSVPAAAEMLLGRLGEEQSPEVRGVIAQTLGRLAYESPSAAQSSEAAMLDVIEAMTDPAGLSAATRGFESLARLQRRAGFRLSDRAVRRLTELTDHTRTDVPEDGVETMAQARRMSLAALIASQAASQSVLERSFSDPDAGVRRLAVLGSLAYPEESTRTELIMHAPHDQADIVRFEIIRAFTQTVMGEEGCTPLGDALGDANPHVTLQVIEAMANCSADEMVPFLVQVIASMPAPADTAVRNWQHPMRAYLSLVQLSPEIARRALPRHTSHSQWQVRMYGAQAAATLGSVDVLYALASDPHHNVRTAALQGLATRVGHAADSVYLRNLASTDYQLVLTAATQLAGSTNRIQAVAGLLSALERITGERRETSRDARVAVITRLGELGSREYEEQLRPYLGDFDPVIADSAAAILSRWTGESIQSTPAPLPHEPFPSLADLRSWQRTRATLHMHGGGEIVLSFRPFEAPTNVARFVRLAREGYFDGLTFHRVVPNFVLQGGSPGANEYVGDGPYTRDELTRRGHWRGTVGLSTRGRDTGDGQIFINLVDNVRLDYNYTIFGDVVSGMDVVDGIMEGAVIDRVVVSN